MGLMTDTKGREKILKLIMRFNSKLCVLCYVVGLLWFLALAYHPLNAGTYFSENALLPGIVDADYYSQNSLHNNYEELKAELEREKRDVPKDWLFKKFQEIGLDVYVQNFSVRYPLSLLPEGQVLPGSNIYAILRAPRASSTEAVVVSSLFRPLASPYGKTTAGIALMLSLASTFKKHTYWAKDIIFLVTEQEQVGMQAWLDGYHGQYDNPYIFSEEFGGRGGAIQAAINLEIASEKNSHVNIKLEGLNGQLPNLDLVNLVTKLCRREGIRPTLHKREDYSRPETRQGFQHSLKTMMSMMWSQATGMPSGNHGLFHRYNIEAVTLESFKKKSSSGGDLTVLAKVVEGTFRSLNNLLERFHQSFFFYVLPATHRYVSIGLYMPPLGLLIAPCLIKAIALWITASQLEKERKEEKKKKEEIRRQKDLERVEREEERRKATGEEEENEAEETESEDEELDSEIEHSTLFQLIPVILVSMVIGILAYSGPELFAASAQVFRLRTDDALTFGIMALFLAGLFFPGIVTKKAEDVHFKWETLKCVALICQSLWMFSAALMNISLAFFLAVVMVPVTVTIKPVSRRIVRYLEMLLLLLISPPMLLLLASFIETYGGKKFEYAVWPSKAWETMKQAVFLAVLDNYLIGNWIYSFFSFAVMPSWLMSWAVCRVEL